MKFATFTCCLIFTRAKARPERVFLCWPAFYPSSGDHWEQHGCNNSGDIAHACFEGFGLTYAERMNVVGNRGERSKSKKIVPAEKGDVPASAVLQCAADK